MNLPEILSPKRVRSTKEEAPGEGQGAAIGKFADNLGLIFEIPYLNNDICSRLQEWIDFEKNAVLPISRNAEKHIVASSYSFGHHHQKIGIQSKHFIFDALDRIFNGISINNRL